MAVTTTVLAASARPQVPADCTHNGHIYHVVFQDPADRERVTERLAAAGVQTALHYVPLHSSPAGLKYGRPAGDLPVTDWVWRRMLRLPMSNALTEDMLDRVIDEFAKI
jgi:dTDP-4-amino-4,6-dideoxygalactose transaminase